MMQTNVSSFLLRTCKIVFDLLATQSKLRTQVKSAIFIGCWLLPLALNAQQAPTFKPYTINDGLAQNSVYAVLQDSKGYLWIGTGNGLNRFDGTDFKHYPHEVANTQSLPHQNVTQIAEDKKHNLWIVTDYGVAFYERQTDKISRIFTNQYEHYAKHSPTILYLQDNTVGIWLNGMGLIEYNMVKKLCAPILACADVSTGKVTYADKKVFFIENITKKLYCIDITTQKKVIYKDTPAISTEELTRGMFQIDKNTWICYTTQKIWAIHTQNNTIIPIQNVFIAQHFENRVITCINKDKQNRIWVAVEKEGMYVFDKQGELIQTFLNKDYENSFDYIYAMQPDRQGNMWIGTEGKGLLRCDFFYKSFQPILVTHDKTNILHSNYVRSFTTYQNKIIVASQHGGLYSYEAGKGLPTLMCEIPEGKNNLPTISIRTIFCNEPTRIWVGTTQGLYAWHIATQQYEPIMSPLGVDFKTLCIYKIAQNKQKQIYVATNNGLMWLEKKQNRYQLKPDSAPARDIFKTALQDSQNRHWLARYYKGVTIIRAGKVLQKGLNDYLVQCFYEDAQGFMWLATHQGLLKVNAQLDILEHFKKQENGLPDNYLYAILADSLGNMWISSNRGLTCFNPLTKRFRNYTLQDGLQSLEFNSGAYHKDSVGKLYVGGINGFHIFKPESLPAMQYFPAVVLHELKIMDKPFISTTQTAVLNTLKLPYFQHTIALTFRVLEYNQPQTIQLAYWLEGHSLSWDTLRQVGEIRLSSLPTGKYKVWVKVCRADGVWSNAFLLLQIDIAIPFWEKKWFIISTILLFFALAIYMGYSISKRIYQARLQEIERQQALEKMRNRISNDMHDEIGSGLAHLILLSELAKNEKTFSDKLQERLGKIAFTSKELMQNLSEIVWTIHQKHDTLAGLLTYLKNYAIDFFEPTDIQLTIDFPENILAYPLTPEFRRNIFLVGKEVLHNILKHAHATEVQMMFEIENLAYQFTIQDNGIGYIPKPTLKGGNGLPNMQKRMEEIGGSFEIKNQQGTVVTLQGILPKNT